MSDQTKQFLEDDVTLAFGRIIECQEELLQAKRIYRDALLAAWEHRFGVKVGCWVKADSDVAIYRVAKVLTEGAHNDIERKPALFVDRVRVGNVEGKTRGTVRGDYEVISTDEGGVTMKK